MTRTAQYPVSGPYDLREVALMGFGPRDEKSFDGVMRLAFRLDDTWEPVGVEVRHDSPDHLDLTVHGADALGPEDLDRIAAQTARIVSADHDGEAWDRVANADPVLARVHALAPGFRPSNFASPYEAAVWAMLSFRRSRFQGITLRRRFAEQHGTVFDLAGQSEGAIPGPAELLGVDAIPGLPADRMPRLHAIAQAALDGDLAVPRLAAMDPDAAMLDLQRLPGIGPFYSALVVVRALGLTDVLPLNEGHTRESVRTLYALDHEPSDAELTTIAEAWRPFRTWATVTLRAIGSRLEAQRTS